MAEAGTIESGYEFDPINIVESIAIDKEWDFDRLADDHIAMAVDGMWQAYAITLFWSSSEETLRMICSFEFSPQADRVPVILDAINSINDYCWSGSFTLLQDQEMILFRYGLVLVGGSIVTRDQIEHLVASAVGSCDSYFPVIQSANHGRKPIWDLMSLATSDPCGNA